MAEETIINKTEKPNSYEFGSSGNRFKLYFDKVEELLELVKNLRQNGFNVEIAVGI